MNASLAALIGCNVHYWAPTTAQQHVRHDEVPFTARIVFVHQDGDVSVRGADHYGATFIDTHVTVRDAATVVDLRHGGGGGVGLCTWPVILLPGAVPIPFTHSDQSQPPVQTDAQRRGALEVAVVQQAAEDSKEQRFQPMGDRAPRTDA